MMDISTIPYSPYQSGYTYTPVSGTISGTRASTVQKDPAFNPVVTTTPADQVSGAPAPPSPSQENSPTSSNSSETAPDTETTPVNASELTPSELQLLEELKKIDTEVRRHEMAHVAAGGRYITSGANFTYQRGPDGKSYAVGGEVSIDTSAVPGDPQATLQKMRQIKSAALAPANPSSQDLKVASKATSTASKALSDLMILQAKEQADSNETKALGNAKQAADSYVKVSNLPEEDTSSFQLAI